MAQRTAERVARSDEAEEARLLLAGPGFGPHSHEDLLAQRLLEPFDVGRLPVVGSELTGVAGEGLPLAIEDATGRRRGS